MRRRARRPLGLETLQRGRAIIEASLAKLEKKKQLPRPVAEILGHIRVTTDVGDLATADAVIEDFVRGFLWALLGSKH